MNDRTKTIIHNMLYEINKGDVFESKEQLISWLKTEVGMTDGEITELDNDNMIPDPKWYMEEAER